MKLALGYCKNPDGLRELIHREKLYKPCASHCTQY